MKRVGFTVHVQDKHLSPRPIGFYKDSKKKTRPIMGRSGRMKGASRARTYKPSSDPSFADISPKTRKGLIWSSGHGAWIRRDSVIGRQIIASHKRNPPNLSRHELIKTLEKREIQLVSGRWVVPQENYLIRQRKRVLVDLLNGSRPANPS